ncbi:hypothetical protein [Nocardioides antri]|uniref:Uncharacterized protein n=1 Tax=Nocardioides antri TaxID=2607659 RepID=A0A5B1M2R8_9ACTN|nr:hypothetical protein [Nocardioides antri]KAA1426449.1 hypothetical protein F0U47_13670 [Nocardioides antri]
MSGPDHLERTRRGQAAGAVLPAEGATLATSLSRGLVLVAHTGEAHLGAPVTRGLLRDLARAQAALPARMWPSSGEGEPSVAPADLPEVIRFRHATSYAVGVSRGEIHLTLRATGHRSQPDVHVELRMDRPVLERLAQQRRLQDRLVLTLAVLLVVSFAVATALMLGRLDW